LDKELAPMKRAIRKKAASKPVWPWGKPLPNFKTDAEELNFWDTYEFEPPPDDEGEELVYEPGATRVARKHVYQVRFDDKEMAKLQALAKRRGVSAAVVLRELVRNAGSSSR
jgi:hypothetical protein